MIVGSSMPRAFLQNGGSSWPRMVSCLHITQALVSGRRKSASAPSGSRRRPLSRFRIFWRPSAIGVRLPRQLVRSPSR